MLQEIIHLNNFYKIKGDPILEIIIPFNKDEVNHHIGKGIVICPGGAYTFCSKREADSVAFSFGLKGYCSFVLYYSCRTNYPDPMIEVACAFDFLRTNADKYFININELYICGFSAGGHLAASYGYLYKDKNVLSSNNFTPSKVKPNGIILCYPVITMGEHTHKETKKNILGDNENLIEYLSVEKNITPDYPKTFIWTTNPDTVVDPINSLMLVEKLKENNIEYKFNLYPFLDHAKSIGTDFVNEIDDNNKENYQILSKWVDEAVEFFNKN